MVRWRVDGPRNPRDYEQDYERDYDQRQKGNQNEVAPADSRIRSRQSPALIWRFRLSTAFQAEAAATLQRAGARRCHAYTCRHAERDAATRTSPPRVTWYPTTPK